MSYLESRDELCNIAQDLREEMAEMKFEWEREVTVREKVVWSRPVRYVLSIIIRTLFIFTGNCHHHCVVQEPYGFVPEAGCPVHDK